MAHLAHYREAHPLPFVITHWINLITMFILIFTGFYIHYPFFPGAMGVCRGVHVFCGMVITINAIVRIVLSFCIKSAPTGGTREKVRDYKTWLPQKNSRHGFKEWVNYYLFLQKDHPLSSKLGSLQKLAYLAIPITIFFMAWTGLALWEPTSTLGISQFLLRMGLMNVRLCHYFGMFLLIIIILFHIYLANIEGTAPSALMLFRKEHPGLVYDPATRNVVGFDGMGKEPSFGEQTDTKDLDKAGIKS